MSQGTSIPTRNASSSRPSITAVKDRYIGKPYPAWSAIGVSELITEGALIEIRAVARDPH